MYMAGHSLYYVLVGTVGESDVLGVTQGTPDVLDKTKGTSHDLVMA